MKKLYFKRTLSALLILIFLFGTVSCSNEPEQTIRDGRLEIIEEKVEYSEEYKSSLTDRFSQFIDGISSFKIKFGISKERALLAFENMVIPKLEGLNVSKEEIDEIFLLSDKDASSIYSHLVYSLGTERAGALFYTALLGMVDAKQATAEDDYASYNQSHKLEAAERCMALSLDLKNMGEEKFARLISSAAVITSTVKGIDEQGESAFSLTTAEILYILDREGDKFKELDSTAEDWETVGRLVTEVIPAVTSDNNPTVSFLYTLKKEAYFASSLKAMPSLFDFYASLAHDLRAEGKFDSSLAEDEREIALASAILSSRDEMHLFYESLHTYADIDSEELINKAKSFYGEEALNTFLNSHTTLSYTELIAELEKIASGAIDSRKLSEVITDALFSVSPYLTFILLK